AVSVSVLGEQTTFGFGALMVGAVGCVTISKPVTAVLAGLVQEPTVHVAVILYVPTLDKVKLVPVLLLDHVTVPAQPLAVSVSVLGAQTTFGFGALMVGAVGCVTISKPVTAVLAGLVHEPTVHVAVMLYVPTLESVKLVPVLLFDHVTVPAQPLAVSVSVLGAQTTFGLGALMVGAVGCVTISKPVTAVLAGLVHEPTVHVAVMLYVPTLDKVKLVPVLLFDHVTVPAQPLAVSVSVLGAQTTFGLGALMVGAVGCVTISKPVTAVLAGLVHEPTVQVAVMLYVPTLESVKLVPVLLLDHVTVPAQPLAVSVSVLGEQTTFGFGALMV
ncbi:hypothetical protein, partial [Emticicia sp. 17c]|uniref:hypothetical protein n=1 Tax=Emticicia sp. 17c TaxID=3127704 RepID=UPI00301CDDC2